MHGSHLLLFSGLLGAAPALAQAQDAPRLTRIETAGVSVLPASLIAETARTVLKDKSLTPDTLRSAFEAIRALYLQRGYPLAQVVNYQLTPDGALTLTVAEGRIRRIVVEGIHHTRPFVVREALTLREGMVYRTDTVQQDKGRLGRLGIFSEVVVTGRLPEENEIADTDSLGQVDLVVRVKEAQTSNVAATVGYGDQSGLVGFVNLTDANLFGTAQQLSAQWQRFGRVFLDNNGFLVQEDPRTAFDITLQRPSLGPKSLAYGVSIYDQNTIFLPTFGTPVETLRSYERRKGGKLQVGRPLGGVWSAALTARHDSVGYDPVPSRLDPPVDALSRARATVGAVGFTVATDTRDRLDSPRIGSLNRLTFESAGSVLGGNRTFTQTSLDLRRYSPLALPKKPGSVFAARLLGGTSTGDVPLSEQYFLGGFDLLRGYEFFSVRGDKMLLGSAEVRIPLGADTTGVAFVDIGNAWLPGQSVSAGGLKTGGGIGLRFQSPVGPIRLDLALGNRSRTYVSLGQSF
ncbi:BamA/OMP85 family outer membrane protein [Armatimonas rosea]|uniref:Outer membrane protein insertion porin family n=1 Tax=Armatimonas rosea TaxID=685828 RepID=A0A7W9SMF4_ARMRO|nr:BamA/TamA family outer membrane protein [Armatimonas rosea]MBB6048524.1 outer membrane protein insertion porin family [Armatimonas rosea]